MRNQKVKAYVAEVRWVSPDAYCFVAETNLMSLGSGLLHDFLSTLCSLP
jgi:hypothetical protein